MKQFAKKILSIPTVFKIQKLFRKHFLGDKPLNKNTIKNFIYNSKQNLQSFSENQSKPNLLTPDTMSFIDDSSKELWMLLNSGLPAGRYSAKLSGPGYESMDFRPYVAGDDARHLVLRRYAQDQRLIVNLYAGELNPHVHILLDQSESMNAPLPIGYKNWYAKNIMLAFAYLWLRGGARIHLAVFNENGINTPGSGTIRGFDELFGEIANWLFEEKPKGNTSFHTIDEYLDENESKPGIAIVISDFAGPPEYFSKRLFDLSNEIELKLPNDENTHHLTENLDTEEFYKKLSSAPTGLDRFVDSGFKLCCFRIRTEDELYLQNKLHIMDIETKSDLWININETNKKIYQAVIDANERLFQTYAYENSGYYLSFNTNMPIQDAVEAFIVAFREAHL